MGVLGEHVGVLGEHVGVLGEHVDMSLHVHRCGWWRKHMWCLR